MAKSPRKDQVMEDQVETPVVQIVEQPAEEVVEIPASVRAEMEAGRKALEVQAANRRAELGQE